VRDAPRAFDFVVTDLNMPELSGRDVARALQRIGANVPVSISSGNLPDQLHNEARQAGVRALVHKQYTLEELGAVIHRVLAGGQRLGLEPLQMSAHPGPAARAGRGWRGATLGLAAEVPRGQQRLGVDALDGHHLLVFREAVRRSRPGTAHQDRRARQVAQAHRAGGAVTRHRCRHRRGGRPRRNDRGGPHLSGGAGRRGGA
jgi:CheY-like chemotaxis protein